MYILAIGLACTAWPPANSHADSHIYLYMYTDSPECLFMHAYYIYAFTPIYTYMGEGETDMHAD